MSDNQLKKRQKDILYVLKELGGSATTREVAKKTGLHVNGVSQSLGALYEYVQCCGGRGGDCVWKIKRGEINV